MAQKKELTQVKRKTQVKTPNIPYIIYFTNSDNTLDS